MYQIESAETRKSSGKEIEVKVFEGEIMAECEAGYGGCEGMGEYVADPFTEEIYEIIVMRYLCRNCYGELCQEI
jgi:hypothetical protein